MNNAFADTTPRAVPADTTAPVTTTATTAATTSPAAAPSAAEKPGIMGMVLPFAIMFGVLYFLMIRPQQKKVKDQQALITSLKTGDEVLTSSGILGTITGVADKVVTLEIADDVRIKILKSQVSQVVKGQVKELA